MATKIQLTPGELQAQATEMQNLESEYSALFAGVSSNLKSLNRNWSANLSNNFEGKINSAQKSFTLITQELMKGAKVANTCAVTFESVDSELAKLSGEDTSSTSVDKTVDNISSVDLGGYSKQVTDAEYATLCLMLQRSSKKENIKDHFISLIKNDHYLPDNDPLKNISSDQINVTTGRDGFLALTITDENGNAVVIFGSTDPKDLEGDIITDVHLALNGSTSQGEQAIALVNELSEQNSNITCVGHSLGGYLATAATLKNSSVTKCIAFDPPGRYDAILQQLFNHERVSKITTYEAIGSPINGGLTWISRGVNQNLGKVIPIPVKWSTDNIICHNIKEISDALGGKDAMTNSWNRERARGGGGRAF